MKPNTRDPTDGTTVGEDVSPTAIFSILSDERRQHALQYLVTKPGGVALGDIAEYVTIKDGPRTRDCYERILTGLVHNHLPRLIDDGFVGYDADQEMVTMLVDAKVLYPYLELASPISDR